jgi:hypothetical protein
MHRIDADPVHPVNPVKKLREVSMVRVVVMRAHIQSNARNPEEFKPVLRVYEEGAAEEDFLLTFGVKLRTAEVKYSLDEPLFGKYHVWIEGEIA